MGLQPASTASTPYTGPIYQENSSSAGCLRRGMERMGFMSRVKSPRMFPGTRDKGRWTDWNDLVKAVIRRFARGNIPAQEGNIMLPEELDAERARTQPIARRWKERRSKMHAH